MPKSFTDNHLGASQSGTAILGVFSVSKRSVTELVPISAFPGTMASEDYIVRAYSTGRVSKPTSYSSRDFVFTLTLETRGYDIFSAYPLTTLQGRTGRVRIATLGLLDKMTGCAAVMSNSIEEQDNGRLMIDTRLKAFGVLGKFFPPS